MTSSSLCEAPARQPVTSGVRVLFHMGITSLLGLFLLLLLLLLLLYHCY